MLKAVCDLLQFLQTVISVGSRSAGPLQTERPNRRGHSVLRDPANLCSSDILAAHRSCIWLTASLR